MLDQNAVLDANAVRRNPVHREAEVRKSSVHDDEIPFSQNISGPIFESWRKAFDEIEQALTARLNMSAVLDVFWRPIALNSCLVSLIKRRVESSKYNSFIFLLNDLIHCGLPNIE